MDKVVFYMLRIVLLSLFLFAVSCIKQNRAQEYYQIIDMVQAMQKELPKTLTEGLVTMAFEYSDTILTIKNEVDETIIPFDILIKNKHVNKELLLLTVSDSEGDERHLYELCLAYNVSVDYHFTGKRSHKELDILISSKEIEQAINTKKNPYETLRLRIGIEKGSLPKEIGEGMIMNGIELRDSLIYIYIKLDESSYLFDDSEEKLKEIKNAFGNFLWDDDVNKILMQLIGNAQCGLCIFFEGSITKKACKIGFSKREIILRNEGVETYLEDYLECSDSQQGPNTGSADYLGIQYSCNDLFSIKLPKTMELQFSELNSIKHINARGKSPQVTISTPSNRIVFQQKGLNAEEKYAFSQYCRIIIEYTKENRSEPTYGCGDVIYINGDLQEEIVRITKEDCLRTNTPYIKLISVQKLDINGFPVLYYSYKRKGYKEQHPPVIVNVYRVFNRYESVTLTFSYREAEREMWKSIHGYIINTFSFTKKY